MHYLTSKDRRNAARIPVIVSRSDRDFNYDSNDI